MSWCRRNGFGELVSSVSPPFTSGFLSPSPSGSCDALGRLRTDGVPLKELLTCGNAGLTFFLPFFFFFFFPKIDKDAGALSRNGTVAKDKNAAPCERGGREGGGVSV